MSSRNFILMILTLALSTSCFNSATTSKSEESAGTESSSVESPTLEVPANLGPTGNPDPVNEDNIVDDSNDVVYYDDPDPTPSPTLPGTPAEKCGVVYKQFNNPQVFLNENGTLYTLQEFSYDSLPFLSSVSFPNDSYTACVDGYVNGSNFYVNTATNKVATEHPLKSYKSNYSFEYCGQLAYVTNYAGNTTLNLQINQYYYIVNNKGSLNLSGIPTISESITPQNSIEACIYSNKAAFKDYNVSFKSQIDGRAIDKGALN